MITYFDQAHGWYITPDSSVATRDGGKGKYSDAPSSAYSVDLQGIVPLFERHLLTIGGYFRTGQAHVKEYELSNWRSDGSKGR
jgi:iron complex outermembrane receptor protein